MIGLRGTGRLAAGLTLMSLILLAAPGAGAQSFDPNPPGSPVKLIFIHHSCGENWLADDNGGLGRALGENNYFVSDTNYGWGPHSIGDRTDITDWPEWFLESNSDRYLEALYNESEQHASYTRTLPDPGGENEIILFKSCYPNSNLEGNPEDPPLPEREDDELSVGNAKAIYNDLLTYFASRPDKLFVVITAPPVQDPGYADNARAFNNWLVNEWLDDYDGANVAVFDFYNVLTGPDTHHRFQTSYIEHSWGPFNTLYYPTDDDHPSPAGNRKATEEFIPLLNVYYHLWRGDAFAAPPPEPPPAEPPPAEAPPPESSALPGATIDDFENGAAAWQVFDDGQSLLKCRPDPATSFSGTSSLRIDYEIASEGWASCSLVYPAPQDWAGSAGLVVYLRAQRAGQTVNIIAYQGESPDDLQQYELPVETKQEAVDGWQRVDIAWNELEEPAWQGDGTAPFSPNRALGLGFILAGENGPESGVLWVDDVAFLSTAAELDQPPALPPAEEPPPEPAPRAQVTSEALTAPEAEEEAADRPGICPGSLALGLLALIPLLLITRR